jgi:hypothetical protein
MPRLETGQIIVVWLEFHAVHAQLLQLRGVLPKPAEVEAASIQIAITRITSDASSEVVTTLSLAIATRIA